MKGRWWLVGIALALVVAILSPLASPHPDGLERVAEDHGFIDRAQSAFFDVIPDYMFPGIQSEALGTIIAGIVGTLLLFGVMLLVGRVLARRRATS